jgi:hypothetical protein
MHGTASQLKDNAMSTHTEEQTEAKPDTSVAVEVKRERMTLGDMIKAAGVMGVGAVLALYLVPKIVERGNADSDFIQTGMFETVKESAVAMQSAADAMDDLGDSVDALVEQQQELCQDLAPLVSQLDRVADAVQEQTAQQAADSEDSQ